MRLEQLDAVVLTVALAATGFLALRVVGGLALAAAARLPGAGGTLCRAAALRVTPALLRRVTVAVLAGGTVAPLASVSATAAALADVPADGAVTALDRGPAGTALDRGEGPAGAALDRGEGPAGTDHRGSDPLDRGVVRLPAAEATLGVEQAAAVVVRRGDSLWAIAARHLGPGARDADIAAVWPRWYAANRAVIGPDPSALVPGQRFVPP